MKKKDLNNLILEAYAEVLSELNEAPEGLYYIKVPKADKASLNGAQDVIETWHSPAKIVDIVDDDGAGNVIMYIRKEDFNSGMLDDLEGNGVRIVDTNFPSKLNESLLDELEEAEGDEEAGAPEGQDTPDTNPGREAELPDATDTIINRFPILKQALVKLHTEEFEEFVDTIDWISPRPTSFRVNLKNGQDYILKWTGKTFEAQIMGKKYLLSKINEYQQALDKLALLYQEGPMSGAGESGSESDADFGGGGGGEFPGGEEGGGGEGDLEGELGAELGGEEGGEEGGEDLSDEPIDFESGEEG